MRMMTLFFIGVVLSLVNFLSIQHSVKHLTHPKRLWIMFIFYGLRYIITGMVLLTTLKNSIMDTLIVFAGILVFRWALILPAFRNVLLNR